MHQAVDFQSRKRVKTRKARETYNDLMFGIKKVFRISSEEFCGYKPFMSVKYGRGPLPNATIRAFTAKSIHAHGAAVHDLSISDPIKLKRLRCRVPMSEANVGTTLKPNVVEIQEQSEFRLARKSSTFPSSIANKIIVRRQDGPMIGHVHWYRPEECAYLQKCDLEANLQYVA
jgi:hypothetical protein